jgi:hypothetical protein
MALASRPTMHQIEFIFQQFENCLHSVHSPCVPIPVFSENPITQYLLLISIQRSQVHYFHKKKSGTSITSVARLMRRLFMIANSERETLKEERRKIKTSALSI